MSPAAVCCRESTTETMQATQTHIFIYMSPLAVCCKQPGHIPLYICPLLQFVAANHTPETMQATRTHILICMSPLAVCCSEINPETMQATLTHNFTYVSCGYTYMFCAYIHMFLVTYMFCAYIHMFLVICMPCGGGKRVLLYICSPYTCSSYINVPDISVPWCAYRYGRRGPCAHPSARTGHQNRSSLTYVPPCVNNMFRSATGTPTGQSFVTHTRIYVLPAPSSNPPICIHTQVQLRHG